MEKHHSRSSAKRVPPIDADAFSTSSLAIGQHLHTSDAVASDAADTAAMSKKKRTADKPSREDVSRCINIWASMYLGHDNQSDAGDLILPSRPWMGRSANSLKRFE